MKQFYACGIKKSSLKDELDSFSPESVLRLKRILARQIMPGLGLMIVPGAPVLPQAPAIPSASGSSVQRFTIGGCGEMAPQHPPCNGARQTRVQRIGILGLNDVGPLHSGVAMALGRLTAQQVRHHHPASPPAQGHPKAIGPAA